MSSPTDSIPAADVVWMRPRRERTLATTGERPAKVLRREPRSRASSDSDEKELRRAGRLPRTEDKSGAPGAAGGAGSDVVDIELSVVGADGAGAAATS